MESKLSYSDEQMALVRVLVQDEACSTEMLNQLTGIPIGSISGLCKKLDIERPLNFGGGKTGAIRRARAMPLIRRKYGAQIEALFGVKNDLE